MAINNFGSIVQVTANGLKVKSFTEIRDMLIQRYKEVYGQDIELDTRNADGVFINDLALIMNNICQTIRSLYIELNPNTATGIYLDRLCALANVTRKTATASTATLTLKNNSNADILVADSNGNGTTLDVVTFIDKAGTLWTSPAITIPANSSVNIIATCSEKGQIEAPIGWIDKTVQNFAITVTQSAAAIVGKNTETDDDLRIRRTQSSGAEGTTVLQSLTGSLLEVNGIRDVKVYNNNTNAEQDTKSSGVKIKPHSIAVVVRVEDNIVIPDETIGQIIYDKLTPGISTTNYGTTTSGAKNIAITPIYVNASIVYLTQNIYWLQAQPVAPKITIGLTVGQNTTFAEEDVKTQILSGVRQFINTLHIGTDLNAGLVYSAITNSQIAGTKQMYALGTVTIYDGETEVDTYSNKDGYYNYSTVTVADDKKSITIQ